MATALVIDDNREAADTLSQMLDFYGIEAMVAYGPRAAMLTVKDKEIDIVFLDINMPGVDGFEVMAFLRRYPQFGNIPMVFVTSDDQPETANRAQKTGALLLIVKPISMEALESTLRKVGLI